MRKHTPIRFENWNPTLYFMVCLSVVLGGVLCCSPGRSGYRRRSTQKLLPLVFKQHVPNVPENSLSASGPSDGRIQRGDERFKQLVPNYNADVVWTDRKGTGSDRIMTRRCKERLDMLAISVQNQWPGIRLRVSEGFDEDGFHAPDSLHHSGRAVDITTSDRDASKYGLLARMAVNSGFDFVYYESRSHIHCSVKKEQSNARSYSGCFHGTSSVLTRNGPTLMQDVKVGDEIAAGFNYDNTLLFSKIIGFLHKDKHMKSVFVQLITENGQVLLLTENHLIFRHSPKTTNTRKGYFNVYPSEIQNNNVNSKATHAEIANPGEDNIRNPSTDDFNIYSTESENHDFNSVATHADMSHSIKEYFDNRRTDDFKIHSSESQTNPYNSKASNAENSNPSKYHISNPRTGNSIIYHHYSSEFQNKIFNSDATHAENVRVGDFVYIRSSNNSVSVSKVTDVTFVTLTGVYAPLTESGTLLVDDVFVSCYAVVVDHTLAHAVFLPVRVLDWIDPLYYFEIYSNSLFGHFSALKRFIDTSLLGIDVENVHGDSESYIHWYARLLCCIMGFFSTICE